MTRIAPFAALALLLAAAPAMAQAPGPFSAAQAARGTAAFNQTCSLCHGEDMAGGAGAPALTGPDFAFGWKGKPVSELFDKISTTMPPGQAGDMTPQQYLDLVTAILRKNGQAPGPAELTPGSAGMKAIVAP